MNIMRSFHEFWWGGDDTIPHICARHEGMRDEMMMDQLMPFLKSNKKMRTEMIYHHHSSNHYCFCYDHFQYS
jgi:hypothetical protein